MDGLTLTGFETRVGLADNVHAALATDDLAIRVTTLGTLERGYNFHKQPKTNNQTHTVKGLLGRAVGCRL